MKTSSGSVGREDGPAKARSGARRGRLSLAAIALCGGMIGAPASAHHSTAAYDYSKSAILSGTVRSFQWSNPHCYLQILVGNDRGGAREWAIETGTPTSMARDGWSKDTVRPGDKVVLDVAPARDGGTGGTMRTIRLASGKVLKGSAAMFPVGGGLPSGGPQLPTLPRATPR